MNEESMSTTKPSNETNSSLPLTSEGLMAKVIVFNRIRKQCLGEMKILDASIGAQMSIHEQLEQCFSRKGALELDYSKRLLNLSKNFVKTEQEEENEACSCLLREELKRLSHYHTVLASLYSSMCVALQNSAALLKSIYDRCCDMGCELNEHIIKTLAQLRHAAKDYMNLEAQVKHITENPKQSLHKSGKSKHSHSAEKEEKELLKRNRKFSEATLHALRARNEYFLLLEATNIDVHKYFVEDLLELLNCLDLGMDALIYRAALLHVCNAQQRCQKILLFQSGEDNLKVCLKAQKKLYLDMEHRIEEFAQRLQKLRTESADICKTLQASENNLLVLCKSFESNAGCSISDPVEQQKNAEIEYYLGKIKEYLQHINSSHDKPKPKLFGGSLLEYLTYTGEKVPGIIKSCCRIIRSYGLKHQGIFRVSGSQTEIIHMKEQFERGFDPLANQRDASDINSIAAVLKLYLRELKDPLIGHIVHPQFLACFVSVESHAQLISHIQEYLKNVPTVVLAVIQYLFAFLHHLSLHASDNMMDAHNLAICFGPTLAPMAPTGFDQVLYQNQVNLFIKHFILHYDQIFENSGDVDYQDNTGESSNEFLSDEADSQLDVTDDDDYQLQHALVQYDFKARSHRELSLQAGQLLEIKKQISSDWWLGINNNGKEGLVPSKYVVLVNLYSGSGSETEQSISKYQQIKSDVSKTVLEVKRHLAKSTMDGKDSNTEEIEKKLFETRV